MRSSQNNKTTQPNAAIAALKSRRAYLKRVRKDILTLKAHQRRVEKATLSPSDLRWKLNQKRNVNSAPDAASPRPDATKTKADTVKKSRPTVIKLEELPTPTVNGSPLTVRSNQPEAKVYGHTTYRKPVVKPETIRKAQATRRFKRIAKEREERRELTKEREADLKAKQRAYFERLCRTNRIPSEPSLRNAFYAFKRQWHRTRAAAKKGREVEAKFCESSEAEETDRELSSDVAVSYEEGETLHTEEPSSETESGEWEADSFLTFGSDEPEEEPSSCPPTPRPLHWIPGYRRTAEGYWIYDPTEPRAPQDE